MPHYDYDKDYPFAAFITNLGKYNEGALVGEWVKFPTTVEELKQVFERIGIGAKDDFGQTYEEWFITDYDCYVDGLYDLLGEYANLDELNYLASKLDDMSQDEYERFQAAMEIGDHTGSIQELINLTENLDCYDIYPDIHDHDDLGRYYIEELDAMQVPEHLRNYIDYEAYGRDIALEESGQFTDLGYVRDTGGQLSWVLRWRARQHPGGIPGDDLPGRHPRRRNFGMGHGPCLRYGRVFPAERPAVCR